MKSWALGKASSMESLGCGIHRECLELSLEACSKFKGINLLTLFMLATLVSIIANRLEKAVWVNGV